jgi:hypothetical protein
MQFRQFSVTDKTKKMRWRQLEKQTGANDFTATALLP